ncbi:MAG: thioredoxin family protein, partial [Desulfobacterales bacterium]|nr:thioredoxin family protein [Desulfobacterales bacterium]
QPLMVSETNFDQQVLGSPLPVLLFAWAPWCPTCRTAMPVIDDFAKDAKGKIRVGKVNVDSSPAISSKYNILSVPQILIFDNGRLQETMPGALEKHEIMMKMARYL